MTRTAIIAALTLAVTLSLAVAQTRSKSAAIPRTADGKPDLSGVWQPNNTRRGTWEEANPGPGQDAGVPPANSALVSERAPYQLWAAKKVLESFNRRAIDDPTAFCLAPGVPRINSVTLFPVQIIQTPQQVAMLYEWFHVFRIIPLNAKHPDDLEPSFMADPVGHWEGDTLVVDVTSFNDRTWLIGAGAFHSEALHVTERYTRVDKDAIHYEAITEDPMVLTKPWRYQNTMMRREGTRIREYECVENNLDPDRYEKLLKDETVFRRK